MTQSAAAIDVRNVQKTYRGKVRALDGVDLRVGAGEVFGLLGPNGAGKTTLVKILMTIVRPTAAAGEMLGAPLGDKSVLGRVGYLPEMHRYPSYLTAEQALDYYGGLSRVDRPTRRRRAEQLLTEVGLGDWRRTKIKGFSKGMTQRLGLAAALINDPDLLVLDEPTDGLDPMGRRDVRTMLQRLSDAGKTVFINSHLLSELEMVCDRVAILNRGRLVRQGRIEDLAAEKTHYRVELAGDPSAAAKAAGAALPDGAGVEVDQTALRITGADVEALQPVIDALRAGGAVIRAIQPVRQSLEEMFVEAVGAGSGAAPPPPPQSSEGARR